MIEITKDDEDWLEGQFSLNMYEFVDFLENFQDAPQRSAIPTKMSGCSTRARHFQQNFQDTSHRSFAQERDFLQRLNEEDELERSSPV